MNDAGQKTPAMIIDELITTNMKCWFSQEAELAASEVGDDTAVAEAARNTMALNARRNALMRALDRVLGFADVTVTGKTFGGKQWS